MKALKVGALPGISTIAKDGAHMWNKARDLAATQRTLEGITSYDGTAEMSRRLDQQAHAFIREYLDSGKSGRLVPPSINLASDRPKNGDR